VCCVKFSPDGTMLATGCNRNTTLYDTKTGTRITFVSRFLVFSCQIVIDG
jgi:glucose repression regulatory protein TUP1